MSRSNVKLGELLITAGRINEFQLNSALSHQKVVGGRLGASLVRLGYISEQELLTFLAGQLSLPVVDFARLRIPSEILALIPRAKALEFNVLPIARRDERSSSILLVAMSDPTNLHLIDALRFITGMRIAPAIALDAEIRKALETFYPAAEPKETPAPLVRAEDPAATGDPRLRELETTAAKYQALLKVLLIKGVLSPKEYERLR